MFILFPVKFKSFAKFSTISDILNWVGESVTEYRTEIEKRVEITFRKYRTKN